MTDDLKQLCEFFDNMVDVPRSSPETIINKPNPCPGCQRRFGFTCLNCLRINRVYGKWHLGNQKMSKRDIPKVINIRWKDDKKKEPFLTIKDNELFWDLPKSYEDSINDAFHIFGSGDHGPAPDKFHVDGDGTIKDVYQIIYSQKLDPSITFVLVNLCDCNMGHCGGFKSVEIIKGLVTWGDFFKEFGDLRESNVVNVVGDPIIWYECPHNISFNLTKTIDVDVNYKCRYDDNLPKWEEEKDKKYMYVRFGW